MFHHHTPCKKHVIATAGAHTGRGERAERCQWQKERGERVAAVKISSVRLKAARKFWAPQQGHPFSLAGTTLPALRATSPYTGEAFLLPPLRKGKSPKRCQWQKKRGDFEEVPRLAGTTVAGTRMARRWAGCHGEAVTEGSTIRTSCNAKRRAEGSESSAASGG